MLSSKKLLLSIVCVLCACFLSVGYASISGTLTISGTATYTVPDIYIVSATPTDANGSGVTKSMTMLTCTSTFTGGSSAVFEIKMANTTAVDYGYLMTTAMSDDTLGADNSLVTYELYTDAACTDKMLRGTVLSPTDAADPSTYLTFYLKISPKDPATTQATTYLNFKFITPVSDIPAPDASIGALAANQAMVGFTNILNEPAKLAELSGQMGDSQAAKDNHRDNAFIVWINSLFGSDVTSLDTIAYVPDTIALNDTLDPSDAEVCLSLFGNENLELIIDGEPKKVYFLIYKTNVDNLAGDEYVLYMTSDPLDESRATTVTGSLFNYKYNPRYVAEVFACVFKSYTDANGATKWYQLGDMATGECTICDYSGSDGSVKGTAALTLSKMVSGAGSFSVADWATTEDYYGLGTGKTINNLMQAKATNGNGSKACMDGLKAQLDKAYEILSYELVVDGVTFTADDIYTAESLSHLRTVYGWGDEVGLSDVYTEIMNGNSTSYTQAMIVTSTRWLNEALVGLKAISNE